MDVSPTRVVTEAGGEATDARGRPGAGPGGCYLPLSNVWSARQPGERDDQQSLSAPPPPDPPGFNFFVDAAVYHEADEFSNLPNEDTALSRQLSGYGDVAYHPEALVETASRRITESGLTGTLFHYVALDLERIRGTN